MFASVLQYEAIGHRSRGSPWKEEWTRATSLLEEARSRLEAVECGGALLPLLLQHARMLLTEAEGTSEHRHGINVVQGAAVSPTVHVQSQLPMDLRNSPCVPADEVPADGVVGQHQASEAGIDLLGQAAELLSAAQAHARARLKAEWSSGCPAEICPPAKRTLAAVEACLARLAMCELRARRDADVGRCNTGSQARLFGVSAPQRSVR